MAAPSLSEPAAVTNAEHTIGVAEAARLLRLSPDALMRRARAGKVPGAKIGRQWVFVRADLVELIRQQARERASAHANLISAVGASRTGRYNSQSAEARLDARLRQLRKSSPQNS